MAVAAEHDGLDRRTVCVIGDGAITAAAGMAFEAMNYAGDIKANLVVVLTNKKVLSGVVVPDTLFADLSFSYIGPVDRP